MKRLLLLVPAIVLLLGGVARADHPAPTGFVVDTTGVLSLPMKARVEAELRDYARRTTNQVAVAIVQSLDGETVEDYARELFNEWGIGTKAKNNGVLLLIALDDRADRVQVGYGLEAVLTDEAAQGVLDDVVTPAAAEENWSGAVLGGERAIRAALHDPRAKAAVAPGKAAATSPFGGGQAQDAPADTVPDPSLDGPVDAQPAVALYEDKHTGFPIGLVAIPVVGIGLMVLLRVFGGRGGRRPTGLAAGTLLYEEQRRHHDSTPSSGGGFTGGSDGGSSGGGGGFGGGSSGGGGASGSW